LPSNSIAVDSLAKVRIGPRCIILIPSYPRGRLPTMFGEKKEYLGKLNIRRPRMRTKN
jgi:hypothetical protein